jgi:predicted phosphodiesterase
MTRDTRRVSIAVLTDVHGNSLALDAVITDARGMGADRFWLLGDLVAMGPDPVGTVQRLPRLEPEFRITGNTDRYV